MVIFRLKTCLLILITGILFNNSAFSQEKESNDLKDRTPVLDSNAVYEFVHVMPKFPEDKGSMFDYLKNNLKYPAQAKLNNIEGKVFLSFIITRSGELKDIKILRGLGSGCDDEAIRLVKNMPNWIPGKLYDQVINVKYTMQINFQLD